MTNAVKGSVRFPIELQKMFSSMQRYLFFLFCGAFFLMPFGTSPYTIVGLCCLVLCFFSGEFYRQRAAYLKQPWFSPVLFLIALSWFGLLWSADASGLGLKFATKTYYWLYAMALACVMISQERPGMPIKALMGGLSINALLAFLQMAKVLPKWPAWSSVGYTGFHSGYNTLSILLVLGILMATFYLKHSATVKEKAVSGALAMICFLHLMIMPGRGGYLTFVFLSPLASYNVACSFVQRRRLLVVVLLYTLTLGVFFSSPIVSQRIDSLSENLQRQLSAEGEVVRGNKYSFLVDRVYMWRWAINLFWEYPLAGVGTGGYRTAILAKGGDQGVDHPHNNLLHMAASFGVLGLLGFGWLFYLLLRTGWKHRNKEVGFFVLASSLVFLVGGMTDTHILDSGGMFLLAVTVGIQAALEEERKGVGNL